MAFAPSAPPANSPEMEATTYAQHIQSIDSAPADFEKQMRITRWLGFVNRSKHLLNEPDVRNDIKQRIQAIAVGPRLQDYDMFIRPICTKLAQKGEAVDFPGCASPPIFPDFKYVAKGSFGCVYSPALPNISANGQRWESYPENVVKFFRKKANLNHAVESAQAIYEELGHNDGHRLIPYKYQSYRKLNGGPKMASCNIIAPGALFPARMPNLGMDFHNVYGLGFVHLRPLKSIPIVKIATQIKKLLTQCVALQTHGKIHGDIRETNLMFKSDGTMTIVDFDLLYPKDDFFLRYLKHFGFYNNPPESLLIDNIKYLFNNKDNDDAVINAIESGSQKKSDYLRYQNAFSFYQLFLLHEFTDHDVEEANQANFMYLISKFGGEADWEQFRYKCFLEMAKTFDSFGVVFCVLELLHKLYLPVFGSDVPNDDDKHMLAIEITNNGVAYADAELTKAYNFLHTLVHYVLLPMVDWNMQTRKTAETALAELEPLLVALQAPGGGARTRRRQRRSKGTRRRHHRK